MSRTIDPQHAEELYFLYDDHGDINTDPPLDGTTTVHGWTLIGSTPSRVSRWSAGVHRSHPCRCGAMVIEDAR